MEGGDCMLPPMCCWGKTGRVWGLRIPPYTQTHSHTYSLSLSLSSTHNHTIAKGHNMCLALIDDLILTMCCWRETERGLGLRSPPYTQTHSHTHTLSLSLSCTHTHT